MIHSLNRYAWGTAIAITLTACGARQDPSPVPPLPGPQVPSESLPSPQASSKSVPSTETFKQKDLPVLGTSDQQMNDQATVLQAVLANEISKIPKTSSAGITPNPIAVFEGYPPEGTDVCNLPYSALTKAIYDQCIKEGMSYIEVSNILGFQGKEQARAGNSATYSWSGSKEGSMSATFIDDKLKSKAQQGLK